MASGAWSGFGSKKKPDRSRKWNAHDLPQTPIPPAPPPPQSPNNVINMKHGADGQAAFQAGRDQEPNFTHRTTPNYVPILFLGNHQFSQSLSVPTNNSFAPSSTNYAPKEIALSIASRSARGDRTKSVDSSPQLTPYSDKSNRTKSWLSSGSQGTSGDQCQGSPGPAESDSDGESSNSNASGDGYQCETCQTSKDPLYCSICQLTLCKTCWPESPAHKPRKNKIKGVALRLHESIDPIVEAKLDKILEPQISEKKQEQMHHKDENTAWFAVVKDELQGLIFQDLGRYGTLVSGLKKKCYPAIVSFVGPTGAGKSTLIRMLIELHYSGAQQYDSPVVKSTACHQTLPTSGDVHLYCDPHTCNLDEDRPILYADCEGLGGGERTPLGARTLIRERLQKKFSNSTHGYHEKPSKQLKRRVSQSATRKLQWAVSEDTKRREFVVSELYPRILYTFSDVVVFVIKETNSIENVLEKLLIWAAAAIEKSSNQPVLPHAFIAMNSLPNETSGDFWDVTSATRSVMYEANIEFRENQKFAPFIKYWEDLGYSVPNIWSLLTRYYESVNVIRIPRKGRSNLISEQVHTLQARIRTAVALSQRMKRERRMLLNSTFLQTHLQSAYDHFAKSLDTPFDFVKAAFANNPIPSDFGGNILKLILNVKKASIYNVDANILLHTVAPIIASCIMLDAARQGISGSADEIFPEYEPACVDAFEDFYDKHWECEFIDPKDPNNRCVNFKVGHNTGKGHQDSQGKIISVGDYVSNLDMNAVYNWLGEILASLTLIEGRLKEGESTESIDERTLVAQLHKDSITKFYYSMGGADKFINHSACFVCLINIPERLLPCGHVICTPCAQTYGIPKRGSIVIAFCPMHYDILTFDPPHTMASKPAEAGIRVLSLDSGGVRAITELVILQHVERALGRIPLMAFFDLVVGTSTGGLIALGLCTKGWSIEESIRKFQAFCHLAFIPRKMVDWPGIRRVVVARHRSKYRTKDLQEALQFIFSENEYLFGGMKAKPTASPKVAVTATSSAGRSVVFADYHRPEDENVPVMYDFMRPESAEHEPKIWEAARATSAAPGFFKEFPHAASKDVYVDGSLHNNNPIRIAHCEAKLIWPESELPPDIVLSIGSGFNPRVPSKRPRKFKKDRLTNVTKNLHWIATNNIESSLDSENIWTKWVDGIATAEDTHRYVRLNVKYSHAGDPPRFDDLRALPRLEKDTRMFMLSIDEQVKLLANHLICTSFYFETSKCTPVDIDSYVEEFSIKGTIHCRFDPLSDNIQKLGRFLSDINYVRNLPNTRYPFFTIRETYGEKLEQIVTIERDILSAMIREGVFELPLVQFNVSSQDAVTEILLSLDEKSCFPISGFPRKLIQEPAGMSVRNRLRNRGRRNSGNPNRRRRTMADKFNTVGTPEDPYPPYSFLPVYEPAVIYEMPGDSERVRVELE